MIALAAGIPVGRYVLTSKLASGGMAEVWLARATGPGGFSKTVVLKTILPHLADDPDFVEMFLDEATLAAALNHPNIVQIFELGELDGGYFIAMEHIAGRTLRQIKRRLRRQRQVPPTWLTLHVCAAVCDALQYAHTKTDEDGRLLHLVHRDVTTDNIMVSFAGETKVVDFGIAKARTNATITRAGMLKGKHSYMAPEQITARSQGIIPDRRVDVYALGVVMYEMLTGTRPFRADNDLALLRRIIDPESPPVPPSQLAAWVTPPMEAIVLKAMAKNPRERFQTAAEFRGAIDQYLAHQRLHPNPRHVALQLASMFPDEAPRYLLDSLPPQASQPPPRRASGTVLAKAPPKPIHPRRQISGTRPVAQHPPRPPAATPSPEGHAAAPTPGSGEHPARSPIPAAGAVFDRANRERAEHTQATSLPPGVWDRLTRVVHAPTEDEMAPAPSALPRADPRSARERFDRALELYRQRDLAGALTELERALRLDPENRVYRSNVNLMRALLANQESGADRASSR